VVPSGRLLSPITRLTGSFTAGTCARLIALQMMIQIMMMMMMIIIIIIIIK